MWVVWRTGGVSVSQFSCAPFPSHRNNLILSANLHPADENSSRSTFTQNNHCRTRSDLTENTRTGASVRSACPLLSQNLCRISERLSSAKNAQRLFYGCFFGDLRLAEEHRFIGLSVFGSRIQAKDHGLRTVQRTAYPTYCVLRTASPLPYPPPTRNRIGLRGGP